MGYTILHRRFSDGARQACVTGNGVDFIQIPPGKGSLDVTDVITRREGRRFTGEGAPFLLVHLRRDPH